MRREGLTECSGEHFSSSFYLLSSTGCQSVLGRLSVPVFRFLDQSFGLQSIKLSPDDLIRDTCLVLGGKFASDETQAALIIDDIEDVFLNGEHLTHMRNTVFNGYESGLTRNRVNSFIHSVAGYRVSINHNFYYCIWASAVTTESNMTLRDHPAAEKIGTRPLYVGNADAASPRTSPETEFVLTLCSFDQPTTTHHHPIPDSDAIEQGDFDDAVDTALDLYRSDGDLFVHCAAGVSRSPTVVATILAMTENMGFDEALEIVQSHRELANPHPALKSCALEYINTRR